MALSFGVNGTASYGLIQEMSKSASAEIAEGRDETGKAVAQKAYSKEQRNRHRFLVNGTMPTIGATLAIGGTDVGLVASVQETETNTGYKSGEVETVAKDAAVLTAYS